MKKRKFTIMVMMVFCFNAFGQVADKRNNAHPNQALNNEVRLNMVMAIAGFPEINYERFIADNMGIGLAAAISLEKPDNMTIRSMVLPYCRVYFGEKKASGFFIECNMAVEGNKYPKYIDVLDATYNTYYLTANGYSSSTSLGFGAAVGFKFLTRNDLIGEFFLGAGRLIGNSNEGGYPRVGICLGKRFGR